MTRKDRTQVDIQITEEGIRASLFEIRYTEESCQRCYGDGKITEPHLEADGLLTANKGPNLVTEGPKTCPDCEGEGAVMMPIPTEVDTETIPWAEIIKAGESGAWRVFSNLIQQKIEETEVRLDSSTPGEQ